MFRSSRSTLLLLAFALVSLAAFWPQPAEASCTGICVRVQGGPFFCRECQDAGFETGALCQQSGPCGCFYVQCFSPQTTFAEGSESPLLAMAQEPQPACRSLELAVEELTRPTPLIDDLQPAPAEETEELVQPVMVTEATT